MEPQPANNIQNTSSKTKEKHHSYLEIFIYTILTLVVVGVFYSHLSLYNYTNRVVASGITKYPHSDKYSLNTAWDCPKACGISGQTVRFETTDSNDQVLGFYYRILPELGWKYSKTFFDNSGDNQANYKNPQKIFQRDFNGKVVFIRVRQETPEDREPYWAIDVVSDLDYLR